MLDFINNIWIALIALIIMFYIINKASGKLGDALHVLGLKLKMPLSVKGATLDAVASSFPEFATAMVSVIAYAKFDDVGVPTIAGSGVYNILIIPMLSMIFFKGKKLVIHTDKKGIIRDTIFYIISLTALLAFGLGTHYSLIGGFVLVGIYIVYIIYLLIQIKQHRDGIDEDKKDILDESNKMTYMQILMWTLIGIAVIWVGIDIIVKSIGVISQVWKIPEFLVSAIILAGATSMPDTILSVKSAKRGDIDGAVSNAIGSNIFNICICLGLPIIVYRLMYGKLLESNLADNLIMIIFLIVSMIVTSFILIKKSGAKKKDSYIMLFTYILFLIVIIVKAF